MRDSPLFPNFHRSGARSPAWRNQRCQRNKCDARNSSPQHANVPRLDSACYQTPAQKNILLPVDWVSSAQGGRCSVLPEVRREGAASHYQNAIPLLTSNTANTLIWNRRIGLKCRAPCPRQNGCGYMRVSSSGGVVDFIKPHRTVPIVGTSIPTTWFLDPRLSVKPVRIKITPITTPASHRQTW